MSRTLKVLVPLVALLVVATPAAAGVATETADVVGQGPGGPFLGAPWRRVKVAPSRA